MFHAKAGWFFERFPNGSVSMTRRETANENSKIVAEIIFSPNEWASIVASVSAFGDHNPYFQQALDFHGGLTKRASDGAMGLRKMDDGSMGEFDWSSDSPKSPRR